MRKNSTVTLSYSDVSGNVALLAGGGIYNNGNLTIDFSTLDGNVAFQGGGIYNQMAATANLYQTTMSDNAAVDSGGGVYNLGTLNVNNNSILCGNSPDDEHDLGTTNWDGNGMICVVTY